MGKNTSMELIINTTYKTIKIKGSVSIPELIKELGQLFPDFDYQQWRIVEYPDPVYFGASPGPFTIQPSTWQGPSTGTITMGGGTTVGNTNDSPF